MGAGKIIKYLRQRDDISREELADALGITLGSVEKYEQSKVVNLKLSVIRKLCVLFNVAPYAFVFPEVWEEHRLFYENDPDIYKFKALYTNLNSEGRQKILAYTEDINQIDRYIRDASRLSSEEQDVFPWRQRKYEDRDE